MGKRARRSSGAAPKRHRDVFVGRPFEGLAAETEWVAMRELVPAASAPVRLSDPEHADREVFVATVLPMAHAGLIKADGRIFLSVQSAARSGDVSRDLAAVMQTALATEPGNFVTLTAPPGPGPRLQDLLAEDPVLAPTVFDSFGFWLDEEEAKGEEVAASLEEANASILPTQRLASTTSAYWCRVPGRAHVRWVLPEGEDASLTALARLHAAGELSLGPQTRYAGSFRAHGLLVPVWDLPEEPEASTWDDAVAAMAKRYADAVAESAPLSQVERRSRDGLRGRQITLR